MSYSDDDDDDGVPQVSIGWKPTSSRKFRVDRGAVQRSCSDVMLCVVRCELNAGQFKMMCSAVYFELGHDGQFGEWVGSMRCLNVLSDGCFPERSCERVVRERLGRDVSMGVSGGGGS